MQGILGPYEEVVESRATLGLCDAATSFYSKEVLYSLELSELVVPLASTGARVVVRAPHPDELAALLEWRMLYAAETTRAKDTAGTRASESARLAGYQERGHHFVATEVGERVAYSAFNATAPDLVQIGGVWTPPALRGRGYGRSVVAGSLQIARDRGTKLAVLFTGEDNGPARAAYVSIGFRPVGDYAIVFFSPRG